MSLLMGFASGLCWIPSNHLRSKHLRYAESYTPRSEEHPAATLVVLTLLVYRAALLASVLLGDIWVSLQSWIWYLLRNIPTADGGFPRCNLGLLTVWLQYSIDITFSWSNPLEAHWASQLWLPAPLLIQYIWEAVVLLNLFSMPFPFPPSSRIL